MKPRIADLEAQGSKILKDALELAHLINIIKPLIRKVHWCDSQNSYKFHTRQERLNVFCNKALDEKLLNLHESLYNHDQSKWNKTMGTIIEQNTPILKVIVLLDQSVCEQVAIPQNVNDLYAVVGRS